MQVQFKKLHEDAVMPAYGTDSAAGMDLSACLPHSVEIKAGEPSLLINTGIAVYLQDPLTVAMIFPRSGLGHKRGLVLGNGTGVIDADYQGELMVSVCVRPGHNSVIINPGDRIAQLVILPIIRANLVEVEEFKQVTARGDGGFGSTGVRGDI